MDPVVKKILIIASAFVLVGGILMVAAITIVGFNWGALNTRLPDEEKSYTYDITGVNALSISDVSSDIIIVPSDGDQIKITCFENANETYDIKLADNGTLRVNNLTSKQWYRFIGINFNNQKRCLTISVPKKLLGPVDASTVSGNINLSNLNLSDALTISTTSGEINLKDVVSNKEISVSSVSGSIKLEKTSTNSDMKLETASGDTKVTSSQVAGNLSCNSISGTINLMDTIMKGNVSLESTSGNIVFINLIGNDIFIKTISSDVAGKIIGDSNNYSITANTVSGDKNLPRSGNGNQLLNVSTTSGDIDIEFITEKTSN